MAWECARWIIQYILYLMSPHLQNHWRLSGGRKHHPVLLCQHWVTRINYSGAMCREHAERIYLRWLWNCTLLEFSSPYGLCSFYSAQSSQTELVPPLNTWRCAVRGKLSTLTVLAKNYLKAFKNWSTISHLKMDYSFLIQLTYLELNDKIELSQEFPWEVLKDRAAVIWNKTGLWIYGMVFSQRDVKVEVNWMLWVF